MENRTQEISQQYGIVNEQYRSLNTTIHDALDNQQKIKADFMSNVGNNRVISSACAILFSVFQSWSSITKNDEDQLINLKATSDSVNERSSVVLASVKEIKSNADFHVQRIEKAADTGKSLTNTINSARYQVGQLVDQVKQLQKGLSTARACRTTTLEIPVALV